MSQHRLGICYALVAYGFWGIFPLYLRAVRSVPAMHVLCHRIVWSFLFLAALLVAQRDFRWLRRLREHPRIVWSFVGSAVLLSINWFVYIWAVEAGRVIDASLGYFINPLVSLLLAVLVLKERLRPAQWASVGLAALGVLWLTALAGRLPWIGLTLAAAFGCYGLLRKTAELDAFAGLTLETALLLPVAVGVLAWSSFAGTGSWSNASSNVRALLVVAGPVTALPLLSFAAGARRISLSQLGILQYLGPTLQLLLGIVVFHEPFPAPKLFGFALIWLSVLWYSLEGSYVARGAATRATTPERPPDAGGH